MNKKSTLESLTQQNLIAAGDKSLLETVTDHFSLKISPHMLELINPDDKNDPIAKQFLPSKEELTISTIEKKDPIGDQEFTKVKGIIHRYPDRCLLTPLHICPVHCRFCFRKEKVGSQSETLTPEELKTAYEYIQTHPEIWEVIVTGGDPFILKPISIKKILTNLFAITHVEIIRIHTRVPCVDPNRITDELITVLRGKKPVYVMLHANHPNEFTPLAINACAKLIDAGIPMLSQTTLLKNINDNIEVLSELMRCFVRNRIKPYYVHHADLVKGTGHFRSSIAKGQSLMKALRGRFSGLCQPTYVLDIPGGYGKAPIGSSYLTKMGEAYQVEDYQGELHSYEEDAETS